MGRVDYNHPLIGGVADGEIGWGKEVREQRWQRTGSDTAEGGGREKQRGVPPAHGFGEVWGIIQPHFLQRPPMPHDPRWEGYLYHIPLQMRLCLGLIQVTRPPDRTSLGILHPLYWALQGRVRVVFSHEEA